MNRIIYPASSYPLTGDLQSHPGDTNTLVVGIQGVPVTQVTLSDGMVLTFSAAASAWVPEALPTATTSNLGVVKPDGTTITITSGGVISAPGGGGGTPSQTDETLSRSLTTVFQNTTAQRMQVSGWVVTSGSSTGSIAVAFGPTSTPPTVYQDTNTASVSSGSQGFNFIVPPGWYYSITVTGDVLGLGKWWETLF